MPSRRERDLLYCTFSVIVAFKYSVKIIKTQTHNFLFAYKCRVVEWSGPSTQCRPEDYLSLSRGRGGINSEAATLRQQSSAKGQGLSDKQIVFIQIL